MVQDYFKYGNKTRTDNTEESDSESEEFTLESIPFIRSEYFTDPEEKVIFEEVKSYFDKYTKNPTTEALLINLDNNTNLNDSIVKNSKSVVNKISEDKEPTPQDWLVSETESWCKDRAIYIAVMDSINVLDKKSQRSTGEIPELLKDALSVSFDTHIGHDVLEDADERFDFYHTWKKRRFHLI